ncbi:iron-sulfur cluster assembly scaffold protein [Arcobacteraceae bacterium]|jgi:nitrogen fixation NifU-like protein|nr:iron-sulfur cluster assembly scaffold protein [Arcobacteraceae bacterium]
MENLKKNTEQSNRINAEILSHMDNPRNYGEMKDSDGMGKCINEKTTEFMIVFIKVNDENILENITYGCQANQDSSLSASIFTEMIKGDTLENALESLKLMQSHILEVPPAQKINSGMVLNAFRAAMINRENKMNGMDENLFTIAIELE